MSLEARCVFDTNATVSALLFEQSVPGRAFHTVLDRGRILLSQATIVELSEVLGRTKFDRYVSREDRDLFLVMLLHDAEMVEVTEGIRECRDPDDDKFLELAVAGGASCVITGDADLLCLHPFRDIPILAPGPFLEFLAAEQPEKE
jgi:putative PIN family toxin of toxin-antitoxin system